MAGGAACQKTKDLGYPYKLLTTRFLAGHARERGPAEGHRMPRRSGAGHGVQDPRRGRGEAAQKCDITCCHHLNDGGIAVEILPSESLAASLCRVLCKMPNAAAPPPASRVSPHDNSGKKA